MVDLDEIRDLASIDPGSAHYVTLYLNVDPLTNPAGEYAIRINNMLKDARESLDKKTLKEVSADLDLISDYFATEKREFKKSVCIITNKAANVWKEYHLAAPAKSELVVEKTPHLDPILDIMDNYGRYLVMLASKDRARIFVTQMGEVTEYGEVKSEDIPGRHAKGGWFALSQDHYERHTDWHEGFHIKEVEKKVESFMGRQKAGGIVIGGPEESIAMVTEKMPPILREKVIGRFRAEMFATPVEILAAASIIIKEYERAAKDRMIEDLIARVYKDNRGVLGIEDVILMTEEKRIQKLMVDSDYEQPGYICPNCRALSITPDPCRFCGAKTGRTSHLVDFIMEKAVEQGGSVAVVPGESKLREAGRIGALLRY